MSVARSDDTLVSNPVCLGQLLSRPCLDCLHCSVCSSVQKAQVMEIADSHLFLRWADSVPCPALFFDFHLVDLALS